MTRSRMSSTAANAHAVQEYASAGWGSSALASSRGARSSASAATNAGAGSAAASQSYSRSYHGGEHGVESDGDSSNSGSDSNEDVGANTYRRGAARAGRWQIQDATSGTYGHTSRTSSTTMNSLNHYTASRDHESIAHRASSYANDVSSFDDTGAHHDANFYATRAESHAARAANLHRTAVSSGTASSDFLRSLAKSANEAEDAAVRARRAANGAVAAVAVAAANAHASTNVMSGASRYFEVGKGSGRRAARTAGSVYGAYSDGGSAVAGGRNVAGRASSSSSLSRAGF